MKSVFIVFLSLAGILNVRAQETRTIYYSSKWEITSKEKATYFRLCEINSGMKNCFFNGKVNDYLMDGRIIMTGAYSDVGLKTGEFVFYHPSGQVQAQGRFENGLRTKTWKYFFENGELERQVKFPVQERYAAINSDFEPVSAYDSTGAALIVDGTGDWHYEYEWYGIVDHYIIDGKVKNGKKHGFWTCSLSNGQLLYREFYKNNIFKEGIVIEGKTQEKLVQPVNNKFVLPYKFEVTESFVYQKDITKKNYPFFSFLPSEAEADSTQFTRDTTYRNLPEDEKIFFAVEQTAEYPGGMSAMLKFILKNLKYPQAARRMGVEGKVWVTFIVEKDGSISNIKISKGVNADLDREAIRIVSLFPNWSPGMQNGHPVRSQFVLPIPFKLD
jgi:TonB family protein